MIQICNAMQVHPLLSNYLLTFTWLENIQENFIRGKRQKTKDQTVLSFSKRQECSFTHVIRVNSGYSFNMRIGQCIPKLKTTCQQHVSTCSCKQQEYRVCTSFTFSKYLLLTSHAVKVKFSN